MKTFLITILLLALQLVSAQDKNQINIKRGIGIPLGEFRGSSNDFFGTTLNGAVFSITYKRLLNDRFSLLASLHGTRNFVRKRDILDQYPVQDTSGSSSNILSRSWSSVSIMGG